jgi:hypothetical protein
MQSTVRTAPASTQGACPPATLKQVPHTRSRQHHHAPPDSGHRQLHAIGEAISVQQADGNTIVAATEIQAVTGGLAREETPAESRWPRQTAATCTPCVGQRQSLSGHAQAATAMEAWFSCGWPDEIERPVDKRPVP